MYRIITLVLAGILIQCFFCKTKADENVTGLKILIANESNDEAIRLLYKLLDRNTGDPELLYLGGIIHNKMMRQDSALVYFVKATAIDSTNNNIDAALASVYSSLRQSSNARNIYLKMLRRDSTLIMPYIHMAELHLRDNEPKAALEIYLLLHQKEPGNYGYIKSIAGCYRRIRDDIEAVRYYRKAKEINSQDLSVNIALAHLYSRQKNYKSGLEIAEEGLEVDRTNAELLFWSGFFNYALGIYGQAILRLQQARDNGNESVLVDQYLGICHFLMNNYIMARNYLEKAIQLNVTSYRLYNYLGRVHRHLEEYELSEKYFRTALLVLSPDIQAITGTYLFLVDTYKLSGDHEKMVNAYRSALVYDPDNPVLHYGLAYTLDNYLDDQSSALEYYIRFKEELSGTSHEEAEMEALLDHAISRIRRINEDKFFENR